MAGASLGISFMGPWVFPRGSLTGPPVLLGVLGGLGVSSWFEGGTGVFGGLVLTIEGGVSKLGVFGGFGGSS